MNLNLGYMKSDKTGYGRMSHQLVSALERQGVICDPVSSGYSPPGREEVSIDEDAPVHANALWLGAPAHVRGWWEGQHPHIMTMWEGMLLPPAFRESMHEFETVIVPSEQNVELFSHHHPNVKKVGLGVDPTVWHYTPRPEVGSEFRFFASGDGTRKGVDVVKKAFEQVFGGWIATHDKPIPTLTIKGRGLRTAHQGVRVSHIGATLPAEDEAALYATGHCYVGLSRGEGWGLMPFQAIAQGMPTILSNAHGHAEFSHLASVRVGTHLVKADPFIFGDAGEWWEPNFDEVCEAMWDVYCNYEDYLETAKFCAAVLADDYSWDKQAIKLIHALGGPQVLDLPDVEERKWYLPTTKLYHITVIADCAYEVNGVKYVFEPGKDYYEFADLKRMMFENGHLSNECLEDTHDSGLLPQQLDDIAHYRAQASRCPTCHQKFNSDPTYDDLDDEEALT